jgi:hypothetical protein
VGQRSAVRAKGIELLICCLIGGACGRSAPAPPTVSPPAGVETINGTERIGWDQTAANPTELAAIRFVLYVDGARTELPGAECAAISGATGYPCAARLPPLSAGNHTLEIAATVQDGGLLESARSAALRVNVGGLTP